MMKVTVNILFVTLSLLFSSCADTREKGGMDNPFPEFALSASSGELVLSQDNASKEVLGLTWGGVDGDASTTYLLELGLPDSPEMSWMETLSGSVRSRSFTSEELNGIIIDKCRAHEAGKVKIKVRLTVSSSVHWKLYTAKDSVYVDCSTYIPVYPDHNHKAPLYWSPYEYNFLTNHYIPEDEWKKNIDWVAENLRSYGYTMVSTDGWMDESNAYGKDGYLDRHSLNWEHDYGWWADYLESLGMSLGVYCNPLWVPSGAAAAGIKVKGTDIPIENLIDRNEENGGYHSYLWVQLDRPGAEEWVRGYVDHFGEMGVKFLRVDFLSWYEDGYDIGFGTVGPDRPDWMYPTALRWMREECDRYGMILSLVMPHLYDDAAIEKNYGHMIRIDNDTAEGGWYHFSEVERGVHRKGWSQYSNAFDGFIYFSRVSGRGKVMLDGDFIRLNTMASDDECKSIISLNVMAGGPVAVSDQYNTIGNRLKYYQNREILELVQDGFVGKPVSDNPPANYTDYIADKDRSQIWTGEMSNGDMIVAIFHRPWAGNSPKTYKIKLSDYGIDGNCTIRDLWENRDIPHSENFEVTIPANGCVVYRISK